MLNNFQKGIYKFKLFCKWFGKVMSKIQISRWEGLLGIGLVSYSVKVCEWNDQKGEWILFRKVE